MIVPRLPPAPCLGVASPLSVGVGCRSLVGSSVLLLMVVQLLVVISVLLEKMSTHPSLHHLNLISLETRRTLITLVSSRPCRQGSRQTDKVRIYLLLASLTVRAKIRFGMPKNSSILSVMGRITLFPN